MLSNETAYCKYFLLKKCAHIYKLITMDKLQNLTNGFHEIFETKLRTIGESKLEKMALEFLSQNKKVEAFLLYRASLDFKDRSNINLKPELFEKIIGFQIETNNFLYLERANAQDLVKSMLYENKEYSFDFLLTLSTSRPRAFSPSVPADFSRSTSSW